MTGRGPALALAAIVLMACAASLALGWLSGYRVIRPYLIFWVMAGLTVTTAWNFQSRFGSPAGVLDAIIRTALVAAAIIVACGLLLAALRRISVAGFLVAEIALCAGSWFVRRRLPRFEWPPRAVGAGVAIGIVGALVAAGVAFAMVHAPLTLYDSLSYHLFFPARWLQEHAISIIPTPFSDEAQAYAPVNGELVFLWLMLPFHGDLFARIGQAPFGVLALVTLYALARRLGASPQHALYPPAFFLLVRPVFEQFIGADVDLICAALFLTSVYLGLVALERDERTDWALWGVSVGLFAGTKYLALVYLPVFLLMAVARGPRVRALWALPGVAMFGLPWYLRNWIAAGSPIYPQTLSVAGVTIAQGAFSRAAMSNSVFHTDNVALLPVMAARAFGPALFAFWIPAVVAGAWLMMRGRRWWPHGVVLVVPLLMVVLYWFGLPVNTDPRFLMPAIAPALVPLAFLFGDSRPWNAVMHSLLALAMVWILVGAPVEIHPSVPWFMSDWLRLNGLLASSGLILFAIVAAVIGVAWWRGPRRQPAALACSACLVLGLAAALSALGQRWSASEMFDVTSPHVRVEDLDAWTWVSAHITGSTVAYTGINLPYPLTGERLTNRVIYANIDGHPSWRLHEYDRAYRSGRFAPGTPALATSSGELRPVDARPGPRDDASRPRYERMNGNRDAWIFNLEGQRADYLFVNALSAYEVDYVWHNDVGFPIEDAWARADPQSFRLVYENPLVRVYALALPRKDRV